MAAAGVGVYVGGSGSGEGYTLDAGETRRVVEIAVDELRGVVPVRSMGIEPRTAAEMIEYVKVAGTAGVEATQIYSLDVGHGHVPTPEEIETYLTDVLRATRVPSVLSTHQSVGYRIPVELLATLVARFDHVIGVNCSHGDLQYLTRIVDAVGDRVAVHVGGPSQALTALALGANGYLSSEANLAPKLCASVIERYNSGDLAGTFDAFAMVLRLSNLLYGHGGIRATKAVLTHLGLPGGWPRKPHLPVDAATTATLVDAIDALGVPPAEAW